MGGTVTVEEWVRRFRAIGLDDGAMRRWHGEFERRAPEAQQAFLLSLGITEAEAHLIRGKSAEAGKGRPTPAGGEIVYQLGSSAYAGSTTGSSTNKRRRG